MYTVDKEREGPWLISLHRLASGEDVAKTEVKTILRNQQAITSVRVLDMGRRIVATSGPQLMFGSSDEPAPSSLKDISYGWHIIECPEYIVSTDIRVRPSKESQKMSKSGQSKAHPIDIVVGGLKGSLHIYEDLPRKIITRDSPKIKMSSVNITPRRLHWHRNAAQAVKWSRDGRPSLL